MSAAKPFPTVIPSNLTAMAAGIRRAADDLTTAKTKVTSVLQGATWKSPQARPAWDAALTARAGDLDAAHQVCDHAANVLTALGTHLEQLKSEYDAAVAKLGTDPWADPMTDDPRHAPSADVVAAYQGRLTDCNDAADSAHLALVLAAQQLASLADGVTFAGPPPMCPTWSSVVDPSTLAVMPLVPAFGAPAGAVYANGVPVALSKGQAFESTVLRQLGISKEMKELWRPDPSQKWQFPRIRGGKLYRGTYPDSRLAGILEIKSGSTSVCASSVQIQLQQALAKLLGTSWSLIADTATPVDPALVSAAVKSGGSVYSKVPGQSGIGGPFYDRATGKYVNLSSQNGQLKATPLNQAEVDKLGDDVRRQVEKGAQTPVQCRGSGNQPPPPPGLPAWAPAPAKDSVTDSEFNFAWDHSKDGSYQGNGGRLPLPGNGGPVPVMPLPGPMPVPAFPVPAFPAFPIPVFP